MELTPTPGVHQQRSLDNVVSVSGNTRQLKSSGQKGFLAQIVDNFLHLPKPHRSEAGRETVRLLHV